MANKRGPNWRIIGIGTPEEVERIKLEEFNKLTTQQRIDLYMEQLSAYHDFPNIRLQRTIRYYTIDESGKKIPVDAPEQSNHNN